MLQLEAWQTHCAFLVHRLQVISLYTLVRCSLSASSVDVWQLHINILHYSMLVSHVMRASGLLCETSVVAAIKSLSDSLHFLSILVSFVSFACCL